MLFQSGVTPKQSRAKKSTTASIGRHPEATPSRHSGCRHPLWLCPRPRLSVLHPPPGACESTFPRLQQQQHFPRHRKRPRGLENESASPLPLQQRHRHHPCRHRRPRKHDGTASPTLRQQRHLHELVVARGLHDTLIQRLTADLQRAAVLASVGVTRNKARARQAPQLRQTATPQRLRGSTPTTATPAVASLCGRSQRRERITPSTREYAVGLAQYVSTQWA